MWKIILFFLLIFGFRVPVFQNSTLLAGLLGGCILFFDRRKVQILLNLIQRTYLLRILIFQVLLIYSAFAYIVVVHQTSGQLLFPKIFIAQFLYILSAILVLPVIMESDGDDEKRILKLFLNVFAIQTGIQLLGFVFPDIYRLISFFQVKEAKDAVESSLRVGLYRGFSLASDLFFGMGVMYGIGFLVWIYYYIEIKKRFNLVSLLIFIALFIGTAFSARTGFIGLLFAFLYFIFHESSSMQKIKWTLKIITTIILILLFTWIIIPITYKSLLIEKIFPFAFEFIYSFLNKGRLETSSTNHLINMLHTTVNFDTALIGDGRYVNSDGSYYMHTDSGYFRNILFWGIPGLLLIIAYQFVFFKFSKTKPTTKLLTILLIIFILVLEIKGEAIAKVHMLNIFLFCLYFSIKEDLAVKLISQEASDV